MLTLTLLTAALATTLLISARQARALAPAPVTVQRPLILRQIWADRAATTPAQELVLRAASYRRIVRESTGITPGAIQAAQVHTRHAELLEMLALRQQIAERIQAEHRAQLLAHRAVKAVVALGGVA
jgi:methylphosphotriester-DNA--protein-cysteine methyltransferase